MFNHKIDLRKKLPEKLPKPRLTAGQRLSDKLTAFGGSWVFLAGFFIFLVVWMTINTLWIIYRWDPYPFILLNLALSCLAAVQAPIILMSQNRTAERDHVKAERDYTINRRAEREIKALQRDIDDIKEVLIKKKKMRKK